MAYIHKEGKKIILTTIIILVLINIVLIFLFPQLFAVQIVVGALSLFLIMFVISFFRNPLREIEEDDKKILAPADGKIVAIEEVFEEEYFKENRLLISVFMSVKNVHVNRSPLTGKVKYVKYHPGKYLVAWHPKSSTENERTSLVFENNNVNLLLRQIAGALARRIVYYVEKDDEVIQGKEFGFIKFGSRVDVYLPIGIQVDVQVNQVVKGGITTLAHVE